MLNHAQAMDFRIQNQGDQGRQGKQVPRLPGNAECPFGKIHGPKD